MGLLSLVMSAWMSVVRLPAMRQAGLELQDAAHTVDLQARLPSSARRVADNYNHLFEAPTVFYAV
ncbi:MAG: MAPEG family protein, partial [Proteobacteria bacterium]|nr:MAPEG family protein [Pseudomonadota bacterium]